MAYEVKGLNEECGLFGVWHHPKAALTTFDGLHSLQHRGQEGAGILTQSEGRLYRERGLGLLAEVFADPTRIAGLPGDGAIGHVRYATAGNHGIENIQPMLFESSRYGQFGLAHNGNLTNATSLRRELAEEGVHFQASSDSELLGHLVAQSSANTLVDAVKSALTQVHGGFAYLIMTPTQLIAALDPNGFRPLVLGKLPDGGVVICSETCALDQVGATFVRDIEPGELVVVSDEGITTTTYTDQTNLTVCSMEYVYFARPDSVIRGVSVHAARQQMGATLAHEQPAVGDVVLGVPNSSLSAATGYAKASGIPYDVGMIKNQYVARTFIEPTQEKRERGVAMKLAVVKSVVAGKRVILVDDSMVRGTTCRHIVALLKRAGAAEVHVRIASPVLKFPCFYGIDIQTTAELIGANHSVSEMCEIIGADSLGFLSVEGLKAAINLPDEGEYQGLCTAYFDGHYPTPLYDYQQTFDDEAQKLGLYKGV